MPKILVVDDQESVLEMLRDHFSRRKVEVLCATTTREGLQVAFKERPDIAVIDLNLPDYSGEELLKRLKKNLPAMHVVILTVRDRDDKTTKERLARLKADRFLGKGSASIQDIQKIVFELLNHSQTSE